MASPLPASSAAPFVLGDRNAVTRVLLFHGFTGSPYEVRALGEQLAARGMHVVGPVLPGHGTNPSDLAGTQARQWLEAGQDALVDLSKDGTRVVVAGLSMGGLLSTCLAAAHPGRVAALILMAPAFRLSSLGQNVLRLARLGLGNVLPMLPKDTPGGDCEDAEARRRNTGYRVIPTAAMPALGEMQRAAWTALRVVQAPTLVIHGEKDRTVPAAVTPEVMPELRHAAVKESRIFPLSRHLLPMDVERDDVTACVVDFLERNAVSANRP